MRRAVIALVLLGGCLQEDSVTCEDGSICPAGTACATIDDADPLCIDPGDVDSCTVAGDPCTPAAGGEGECFEAAEYFVCMGEICGDSVAAAGEQCDDGNQLAGDGCAADCLSDESCGNGVRDGIAFEQCDDGNLLDHDGCTSSCRPERAVWSKLDLDRMAPRGNASMAYDAARGVTVLFGGASNDGLGNLVYFDETWLWNGLGWSRVQPVARPSARGGSGIAYDSARDRIVLFGGDFGPASFSDTWEWDGASWLRRTPAVAPPPRTLTQMAYDSRRRVVVMFGGVKYEGGVVTPAPSADTWEWDGASWTETTPALSPPPRAGGAMTYDAKRGRIVMFGGAAFSGSVPPDIWEYDGTWRKVTATGGPSARSGTAMAYDGKADRTFLFGGNANGVGDLDDLWSWNGTTWQSHVTAVRPQARSGHSVAVDTRRGRFVVAGGVLGEPSTTTWEWNGVKWDGGVLPDPAGREYGGAAFDPVRGRAVMVDDRGETWESDGRSWIATGARAPVGAPLVWDPIRQRVLQFGGHDGNNYVDETRTWDGTRWATLLLSTRPPARAVHAMAFDAAHGHVVVFGGYGNTGILRDSWVLDGTGWHAMATPANMLGLDDAVAGYDPVRRMVIMFGGLDDARARRNETWIWTGTTWEERSGPPNQRPRGAAGASMAFDAARSRLVMFGGGDGILGTEEQAWEWGRYEGTTFVEGWVPVEITASPAHRRDAAMFASPSGAGVVVMGGHGADVALKADDQWLLRWESYAPDEACIDAAADVDGDKRAGCDDLDCWAVCSPACPPHASCDSAAPRCGDGMCSAVETCRMCPVDCGACTAVCGDGWCDAGESCAGDCP